jgi:hypothetical protein
MRVQWAWLSVKWLQPVPERSNAPTKRHTQPLGVGGPHAGGEQPAGVIRW